MATDRFDGTTVVALAVAVLGIIPAVWLVVNQPEPLPEVAPVATFVTEVPVVETIVETVTTEPIEVAGLDPTIAAVLQEEGFLGRVDSADPETAALDPVVAAVLADHDVVLRVAQDGETP